MKPAFTTSANPATVSLRGSVEVADDGGRWPEGAHQVLSFGRVDAGLSADRRVDHAEYRRRDLDHGHPAQPGRRDEAREISDRSPAEADDGIGASEVRLPHHLPAERGYLDALAGLGVGHLGEKHLSLPLKASSEFLGLC